MSDFFQLLQNLNYPLICWYSLLISAGIIFLFHVFFFFRLIFYKTKIVENEQIPISVIICAKNEYHRLQRYLPLVLEQDYPNFEVVVVNDCSYDETPYLLKDLSRQYSHLKIVNLYENVNFFRGKKLPLSVGIKSASYDYLLLTDADCFPKSKNWITEMAKGFKGNKSVVLGYGAYETSKGLLNKLIRYDSMQIALQYFSYALAGLPYMGVGRNLAYKKELFFNSKGFTSHYKIASGDDDLFINKVAKKSNTTIVLNKEAHTVSECKKTWYAWIKQKRRHITTASYYKFKHKFLLGLYNVSKTLFFVLLILSFVLFNWQLALLVLAGYWILLYFVNYKIAKKLDEKKIISFSPFFDLFFVIFNPLLLLVNLFRKKETWK